MVGVGRVVFPTFDSLSKTLIGKFHWKKEKKYRQLQKQNEELFDKYNKDEMIRIADQRMYTMKQETDEYKRD